MHRHRIKHSPVREVINEKNGLLVPFFDSGRLADRVIEVLASPEQIRKDIRTQARQTIISQYNLTRICLPKMVSLINNAV